MSNTRWIYFHNNNYNLLFLDIELSNERNWYWSKNYKNENGLHDNYHNTLHEIAIDGYKINAERYFIKPIDQSEFDIEMTYIIHKYHSDLLGFNDIKLSKNKIYFKNILYFEFYDRKTIIHFTNGKNIQTNYPLKHWIQITQNAAFSQPHKSFLVNLNYISALTKNDIVMLNDDIIPLI